MNLNEEILHEIKESYPEFIWTVCYDQDNALYVGRIGPDEISAIKSQKLRYHIGKLFVEVYLCSSGCWKIYVGYDDNEVPWFIENKSMVSPTDALDNLKKQLNITGNEQSFSLNIIYSVVTCLFDDFVD